MTSPFDARVREESDRTWIILTGRIDREADATLDAAYLAARRTGSGPITLDFRSTDYINSTGIALIVRLLAEARRDRREVVAVGLSEHYREIFRITRLSDYITITDDPFPTTVAEEAAS